LIIDVKNRPRATSSLVHARETITNVVKRMYKRWEQRVLSFKESHFFGMYGGV